MSLVDDAAHLALVELDEDIIQSLREEEYAKASNASLVHSQPQIHGTMRVQLLEFLAQAQSALGLLPETLTLAVSVLDRYMSRRVVFARHYQLLGCVCLWLAAKTIDNKIKLPTTATLSYLCGNTYAESMFKEMELHVLVTLDWNILAPTTSDFIDISLEEVSQTIFPSIDTHDYERLNCMAKFICECALFSPDFIGVLPSTAAASSVALATTVLDTIEAHNWPTVFPTGCAHECFEALVSLMSNPSQECINRHGLENDGEIPSYFSEFFARLAESARKASSYPIGAGQDQYSYTGYSEPSTPVRSRQMSFDSSYPITPFDDDLVSPSDSSRSPDTYFVPLTPEKVRHQESLPGIPSDKGTTYYRYNDAML